MTNKNGFDFTKIKKHGYVPIAKPAIHLSTRGIITFYCIDVRKKLYFRVARKGNLVGFEFSEKKFDNSFSIWRTSPINYTFSAKSKGIVKEIELAKNIGAGNLSANSQCHKMEKIFTGLMLQNHI